MAVRREGRGHRLVCAALAASLAAVPGQAQEGPAPGCAVEREALRAELAAVRGEIADIALGRSPRKRKKISTGKAARGAAGAAAGILLPFPFSLAIGAAGAAAGGSKARPAEPAPDVPALIERQRLVEARLAELAGQDCG